MTEQEAILKAKSGWWKTATAAAIVEFQLYEDRLCMPFDKFHEAVEKALGRPVWTHEFADGRALRAEFEGKKRAPTMQEILGMVSPEKTIVIALGGGK